jgi:hypothetical protein
MDNTSCKGSKVKSAKLSELTVEFIKQWLADGIKVGLLAKIFGVNPSQISRIKHNKTWKHVRQRID